MIVIGLGSITVDILIIALTSDSICVSIKFSKVPCEPLWKFSLFSFSFHLGQVQHVCGL